MFKLKANTTLELQYHDNYVCNFLVIPAIKMDDKIPGDQR